MKNEVKVRGPDEMQINFTIRFTDSASGMTANQPPAQINSVVVNKPSAPDRQLSHQEVTPMAYTHPTDQPHNNWQYAWNQLDE